MDDVRLRRRLTAVLLADVVGYSRLMNADEEGTHLRLADHVKILIEPAVATHRGRLIRSMGDGMLVEFDSAVDAIRCGIDIQRGLAAREPKNNDQRIQLRIGINTGDVIVDERDIYGNSINIAARLEGLAEPGQIYVTRGVRDQLRGYPDISFEDKGEHRVKNIDRPIRVFRVGYDERPRAKSPLQSLAAAVWRPLGPILPRNPRMASLAAGVLLAALAFLGMAVPPGWFKTAVLPPRNSIVVMPFNNFSGDAQQGYVADALTDDVTTDLARLKGIFVIARGTAFTFKGRTVDAREVGKECGVRYLLEGSIVRDGTRLETNVQLIDTETGAHVWADRFESNMSDLFQLLSAVTGRISASLDIQLAKAEGERAMEQHATDPDVIDLRFRAMALYIAGLTPDHLKEARGLLEQSVRLDPSSAESWAWLGEVIVTSYLHRWNNPHAEDLVRAEQAAGKALALDPTIAQAYYTEGLVLRAKGEHNEALEAFSRAVELNPNMPRALAEKGNELTLLGDPQEVPVVVEKAIKLSPRDPALGGFYWIIGKAYFVAGAYPDAIAWLRKSVALRQDDWYNRLYLVSAYALDHQLDQAKKTLREFNNSRQFAGYTLQRVAQQMKVIPNENAMFAAARQKVREGLQIAGMPAR
ncbi:MAG TPA: tetratricopeptide repeat protein [Stellaceae bacterium]|jgi:class 3 adenylate cyclase/TolB-like protein/Tfp pilus assembly protein PilF